MTKIFKFNEYNEYKENSLPNDIENQIKNSLSDIKDDVKQVVLKSEDDGNQYIIDLDSERNIKNIEKIEEFNESFKKLAKKAMKALASGAILLTLASGMVSCEKYEEGANKFSYNIGGKYIKYDTTKGDKNKKILILLPSNNEKEVLVDSTLGVSQHGMGSSSGTLYNRRITPTEARILKCGYMDYIERKNNNGAGYDNKFVYDYEEKNMFMHRAASNQGGYTTAYGSPEDPRETVDFQKGLDYLEQFEGENREKLIQKADEELSRKEWFRDDF